MSNVLYLTIPVFIAALLLERRWAKSHPEVAGYEVRDTLASLSMGALNVIVSLGAKLLSVPLFQWCYDHRIADLGEPAWGWLVLIFAEDLCYYWFHRLHHEVRLLWAAHVVHHSSQHYNFSTALRQTLLTPFTAPLFWTPLAFLGFPVWMIFTAMAWSLIYQFWLHTESVKKLGVLELVLNTPSHHRVHHGRNIRYLDKNHGGIFIVWDRLFGTFALETEPVRYGLTKNIETFHPLKIGTHELVAIAQDVASAPTLATKLGYVFRAPGWSHDGRSQTAAELQRGS